MAIIKFHRWQRARARSSTYPLTIRCSREKTLRTNICRGARLRATFRTKSLAARFSAVKAKTNARERSGARGTIRRDDGVKENGEETGGTGRRTASRRPRGGKIERRTCPSVHQPSVIRATDRLCRCARRFSTFHETLTARSRVPRGIALIYVDTIFIRTDR